MRNRFVHAATPQFNAKSFTFDEATVERDLNPSNLVLVIEQLESQLKDEKSNNKARIS